MKALGGLRHERALAVEMPSCVAGWLITGAALGQARIDLERDAGRVVARTAWGGDGGAEVEARGRRATLVGGGVMWHVRRGRVAPVQGSTIVSAGDRLIVLGGAPVEGLGGAEAVIAELALADATVELRSFTPEVARACVGRICDQRGVIAGTMALLVLQVE